MKTSYFCIFIIFDDDEVLEVLVMGVDSVSSFLIRIDVHIGAGLGFVFHGAHWRKPIIHFQNKTWRSQVVQ